MSKIALPIIMHYDQENPISQKIISVVVDCSHAYSTVQELKNDNLYTFHIVQRIESKKTVIA